MQTILVRLPHTVAYAEDAVSKYLKKELGLREGDQLDFRIKKSSIDARKKPVMLQYEVEFVVNQFLPVLENESRVYSDVRGAPVVIVVGAGPAGLFAALRAVELGFKPIVIERGKDVKERRRDIALLNKKHIVHPDSNYCFGEGGAGTYSDGKLYTRSKKRGDVQRILQILIQHGATSKILLEAHPHIGTNKLPKVVENIRNQILQAGGEIYFETRVTDFAIQANRITAVVVENGQVFTGLGVILATGHSARDIFELLYKKRIDIEAKPFALGVRVEHPQAYIDQCQYDEKDRGMLPAASYTLVAQTYALGLQRGVFSFCMCPGGFIVPASTEQCELVVNGMSPSRRDADFANSGVVVEIKPEDWQGFLEFGSLAAMKFQQSVEQKAYWQLRKAIDADEEFMQYMPAQKIKDFMQNQVSKSLNPTSYKPGLFSINFHDILPKSIAEALKEALKNFAKKMKNYDQLGQMIGIESRTSSPVRIPRDKHTLMHPQIMGLYPCGEGAGYAGGIVSAAIDGERCMEQFVKFQRE